jgi:hypothetical protein
VPERSRQKTKILKNDKIMKNTFKMTAVAVAVAAFAGFSASAVPELTLDINGSTTGTTAPNPISSPANNSTINIQNSYSVGVYTISGFGTLANASTVTPVLDLDTLTLSTTGAGGPLTIELLYSGITPNGSVSLFGGNNGAMSGTTGYVTWAFTADTSSSTAIGLLLTLTSTGAQSSPVSLDGGLSVPDGGMTVGLMGLALGACGLFARKLKRA